MLPLPVKEFFNEGDEGNQQGHSEASSTKRWKLRIPCNGQ